MALADGGVNAAFSTSAHARNKPSLPTFATAASVKSAHTA